MEESDTEAIPGEGEGERAQHTVTETLPVWTLA